MHLSPGSVQMFSGIFISIVFLETYPINSPSSSKSPLLFQSTHSFMKSPLRVTRSTVIVRVSPGLISVFIPVKSEYLDQPDSLSIVPTFTFFIYLDEPSKLLCESHTPAKLLVKNEIVCWASCSSPGVMFLSMKLCTPLVEQFTLFLKVYLYVSPLNIVASTCSV